MHRFMYFNEAMLKNLENVLYEKYNGKVQTGPFQGMRMERRVVWDDRNFTTKIIGSYEFELHGAINKAVSRAPDTTINVGCAEGYYSVGIGRRLPYSMVYAMDASGDCLGQCERNAMINGLMNFETVVGKVGPQDLIRGKGKKLYIVDVEGYELGVLDPEKCADLYTSDMIIECHDFFYCGHGEQPTSIISDSLEQRFSATHFVERIQPNIPRLGDYPCLNGLVMGNALLAITEKRPYPTCWLACWAHERRH